MQYKDLLMMNSLLMDIFSKIYRISINDLYKFSQLWIYDFKRANAWAGIGFLFTLNFGGTAHAKADLEKIMKCKSAINLKRTKTMNKKQVKRLSDACIYHALGRYIETNFLESEYFDRPISLEDQKKIKDYSKKFSINF